MKSELKIAKHSVIAGANIIEIWFDGKFVGQVTGADGPGIRVLSKYSLDAKVIPKGTSLVSRMTNVTVVSIGGGAL